MIHNDSFKDTDSSITMQMIVVWEAAVQRCSKENVFGKYAANLQENIHAEVWFQ